MTFNLKRKEGELTFAVIEERDTSTVPRLLDDLHWESSEGKG